MRPNGNIKNTNNPKKMQIDPQIQITRINYPIKLLNININISINIMLKEQLQIHTKRISSAENLSHKVRPTTTYQCSPPDRSEERYSQSRGKTSHHQNPTNTSINEKNSFRNKPKIPNHIKDLKIKLTSLKQEVNQMIYSQEVQYTPSTTPLYQLFSDKQSQTDEIIRDIPLETIIKKRSFDKAYDQRIGLLRNQNQLLKKNNAILKEKYKRRIHEAQKQILSLTRKLVSTQQMLEQNQANLQEYKKDVETEMQEIRMSLNQRNLCLTFNGQDQRKMKQQNQFLKMRLSQLTNQNQSKVQVISTLQEKIRTMSSENVQLKTYKLIELSKLSQIRVESQLFELSKSKINVEEQKEQLTKNLQSLQNCLQTYKEQIQELTYKVKFLQEVVKKEKTTIIQKQKELDNLRSELLQNRNEMEQLNDYAKTLLKTNNELLKQIAQLQKQKEELQSSPQGSIINFLSSEISVKEVVNNKIQNSKIIQSYQLQISKMQQEIRVLKQNNGKSQQISHLFEPKQCNNGSDFLDKTISQKNQEIRKLSHKISCGQSQLMNIKSQLQMQKIRHLSQQKQIRITLETSIQSLKSEVETLKKVNDSINQKIKMVVEDGRKKDKFIQKQMFEKVNREEDKNRIQKFFQSYVIEFPIDYLSSGIFSETRMIQELKKEIKQRK